MRWPFLALCLRPSSASVAVRPLTRMKFGKPCTVAIGVDLHVELRAVYLSSYSPKGFWVRRNCRAARQRSLPAPGAPRGRHRRAAQSQSANRTPSRSHNSIIRHGLQCLDQKLPATTVAEMCRLYFSTSEFGHHFSRQISVATSAARCRSPLQPPVR